MEESKGIRSVYFLMNDPRNLGKTVECLKHAGYEPTVLPNISKFVQAVIEKVPDVVLLSWNLKGVDVRRVYEYFVKTLQFKCIVFAETDSALTLGSLMRTRIPDVIFPPINGPSVQRRLQNLARKKKRDDKIAEPEPEVGGRVYPSIMPAEEESAQPANAENEVFDDEFRKMQAALARFEKSATPIPPASKKEPGKSARFVQLQELLSKILQSRGVFDALDGDVNRGKARRLMSVALSADEFSGFLVCPASSGAPSAALFAEISEELCQRSKESGSPLKKVDELFEVEIKDVDLESWMRDHSDFVLEGSWKKDFFAVAFVPFSTMPTFDTIKSEHGGENFVAVNYRLFLSGETSLTFDLYLNLPQNEKYLLYIKKGSRIPAATLEKFLRFNVTRIFLVPDDKSSFLSYCLLSKIKSGVKCLST